MVLRKMSTSESYKLAESEGDGSGKTSVEKAKATIALMADLIVEWNLCDEDNKLVDVNDHDAVVATLMELPSDMTQFLSKALAQSLRGRSAESAAKFPDTGSGNTAGDAAQELVVLDPLAG